MNKCITVVLFLLVSNILFGQKQVNYKGFDSYTHDSAIKILEGDWSINKFIVSSEITESLLFPLDSGSYYINKMTFDSTQTFTGRRRMRCGFGCELDISGKYKVIDENYVCFYIKKNQISSRCSDYQNIISRKSNDDLGLYFYYKTKAGGLNLLRSKGDLDADKQNARYCEMLTQKSNELYDFGYTQFNNFPETSKPLFLWEATKHNDQKEIIDNYMKNRNIKNYEILYSRNTILLGVWNIVLLKINNNFEYVVFGENVAGLYDNTAVSKIDSIVQKIESYKNLKAKTYKTSRTNYENTQLTVLKSKNEIAKIKYNQSRKSGIKLSGTVYLQNEKPIYIEQELILPGNQTTTNAYYIFDWEKNSITKKYIKNGIGSFDQEAIKLDLEGIKTEIHKLMDIE